MHHDKLPEYYLDADLFVLPSLAEGMANVVLEAIGSGLPVVATPVGGSEELIRQNENGVIVPTKDVNALADALIRLINSRELREKMGRRSRQIAAHYSWEFVADAYARFYERMKRS